MAEDGRLGLSVSVYAAAGDGPAYSICAQGRRRSGTGYSLVVGNQEFFERRIKAHLSLSQSLPNSYYGVMDPQSGSVDIGNEDGAFTFLAAEEVYGNRIRIRRYDEDSGEVTKVFEGEIDSWDVDRSSVTINFASYSSNALDIQIPRNRIVSHDLIDETDGEINNNDVEVVFVGAKDIGEPIPVVFGRANRVPLGLISEKPDADPPTFDYIVCEGLADVEEVFKPFGDGKYYPAGSSTVTVAAYVDNLDGTCNVTLLDPPQIEGPEDFFIDQYAVVTGSSVNVDAVGQQLRITGYDSVARQLLFEKTFAVLSVGDTITVREWGSFPGTIVTGRTVVRFHQSQTQDFGGLQARVARYHPVFRNLCRWTEQIWNPKLWRYTLSSDWDGVEAQSESPTREKTASVFDNNYHGWAFQRITKPAGATTFTASLWAKALDPDAISEFSIVARDHSSSGAIVSQRRGVHLPTTEWVRYATTFTGQSGDGYFEIGAMCSSPLVAVWGMQLEVGTVATDYEPVANTGQGFRWSIPDAIREILSNPVWGANQQVSAPSFAQALVDLSPLMLRVCGCLPTVDGDSMTVKEFVEELMRARGLQLGRRGSVWTLTVDKPRDPVATFGTDGTSHGGIISMSPISNVNVSQVTKKLRVRYGGNLAATSQKPVYPFIIDYVVGDKGQPADAILHFANDPNTADRIGQYITNNLRLSRQSASISVGDDGRNIQLGNLVQVIAPDVQPENRLLYSEDFSQAAWTVSGGTATARAAIDPPRRARSATRLTSGATANQAAAETVTGEQVFGRVWVKSDAPSNAILRIIAGAKVTTVTSPTGTGWHEMTGSVWSSPGATVAPELEVEIDGGAAVYVWGAQLTFDYQKAYKRTGASTVLPQLLWRVTNINRSDADQSELSLLPYSTTLYDYVPAKVSNDPDIDDEVDPRTVPPDPPTDFIVPPSAVPYGTPPPITAAAGVDQSTEGNSDSWAVVSWTMPARAIRCYAQRRKIGTNRWEDCGTVETSEIPVGQTASLDIHYFTAGLGYELRVVSVNSASLTNYSVTGTFVAWGDTVAPAWTDQSAITVVQGTGRSIEVRINITNYEPDVKPVDFLEVEIYRTTDDVVDTLHAASDWAHNSRKLAYSGSALRFVDQEVKIGKTYYYFAYLLDRTRNKSDRLGTAVGETTGVSSGALGRIPSEEIETLTVGTIDVKGPEDGTGVAAIRVWDSPGAELSFVTTFLASEDNPRTVAAFQIIPGTDELRLVPGENLQQQFTIGGNIAAAATNLFSQITLRSRSINLEAQGGLTDPYIGIRAIGGTILLQSDTLMLEDAMIQTYDVGGMTNTKVLEVYDVNGNFVGAIPIYV